MNKQGAIPMELDSSQEHLNNLFPEYFLRCSVEN